MAKSAMIRARVDPQLKAEVEAVLEELGLSATQAITLFYQQIRLMQGLPFEVRIPNETTVKTFLATDNGKDVMRFENIAEMFDSLGI